MSRLFTLILFSVFFLFQPGILPAEEKYQNNVIAIVDGKKITQEELARRMKNFTDVDPATRDSIKQETIDQLITDILLEKFIDKQGVLVTQEEIEREINQIRDNLTESMGNTTQSLEQVLATIGSDINEFKKSIKHSIALEKYFHDKLTDKFLEEYFEKNKNLFNSESVKVSHILIDTRDLKTEEEMSLALKTIRDIKKEIDQGFAFDEAAKKYSHCPSALQGGNLGFIQRKGDLAKSFLDTAFSLQVGQVSEPVQTEYGYHLIKVTGKNPGFQVRFTDVREKVRLEALDEEILKLLDRLRKEAQIVIKQ